MDIRRPLCPENQSRYISVTTTTLNFIVFFCFSVPTLIFMLPFWGGIYFLSPSSILVKFKSHACLVDVRSFALLAESTGCQCEWHVNQWLSQELLASTYFVSWISSPVLFWRHLVGLVDAWRNSPEVWSLSIKSIVNLSFAGQQPHLMTKASVSGIQCCSHTFGQPFLRLSSLMYPLQVCSAV
jgi:hypothetical protein